MKKNNSFTFQILPSQKKQLQKLQKNVGLGVSVAALVRQAITEFLEKETKKIIKE